ncbi:hypothetical protein Stsp02_51280 [Streptomyces sp. NBRC 14336]|nr:hypothetical protein Stsp02_51280 [Streptomyces sp. NBRC 14336]
MREQFVLPDGLDALGAHPVPPVRARVPGADCLSTRITPWFGARAPPAAAGAHRAQQVSSPMQGGRTGGPAIPAVRDGPRDKDHGGRGECGRRRPPLEGVTASPWRKGNP